MANSDRDTVYTNDGVNRTVVSRESNSTAWFVGIIVALALLAIAYLVFSANSQPTSTTINNTPAVTAPAIPDTTTTPMAPTTDVAPTAPADTTMSVAPSAPATDTSAAPATSTEVSTAPLASSAL